MAVHLPNRDGDGIHGPVHVGFGYIVEHVLGGHDKLVPRFPVPKRPSHHGVDLFRVAREPDHRVDRPDTGP